MNKTKAISFFAMGFFAFTAQAQIKLNNIGVGVSYWERSYTGVDERAFFVDYQPEDGYTKGSIMPHLSAELNLYRGLALDGRIGIWTGDFEKQSQFGDISIDESIEQVIIPVSVGLLYRFNSFLMEDVNLYAGAGLNRYFIQNDVHRDVTGGTDIDVSESFSGNNYGANIKAGGEYFFTPSLGVALEARYNTGSFNQNFRADVDEDMVKEKVSLKGIEVGVSLRYRFSIPAAAAPEAEDEE